MRFKDIISKYINSTLIPKSPFEAKLSDESGAGEGKLDIYSPTWVFVSKWATDELAASRERNDYLKNDETKTAALRGRIKLLKEILDLPKK